MIRNLTKKMHLFHDFLKELKIIPCIKAQYQYSLQAVIVHSGGIDSGHYITYRYVTLAYCRGISKFGFLRKGPIGSKSAGKWFYTSDGTVKQVSYDEVSRSAAYMLFYEKLTEDLL